MNASAAKRLDEKTLVPISFVITLLGLGYWVSSVAARGEQNEENIVHIQGDRLRLESMITEKLDNQSDQLSDIKATVSAMNAKLEMMREERRRGR